MSRTLRSYPPKIRTWRLSDSTPALEGRDGAVKLEKHLKRADRYTGWTDDGIWTPEAKRRNKRKVARENRHHLNALRNEEE